MSPRSLTSSKKLMRVLGFPSKVGAVEWPWAGMVVMAEQVGRGSVGRGSARRVRVGRVRVRRVRVGRVRVGEVESEELR